MHWHPSCFNSWWCRSSKKWSCLPIGCNSSVQRIRLYQHKPDSSSCDQDGGLFTNTWRFHKGLLLRHQRCSKKKSCTKIWFMVFRFLIHRQMSQKPNRKDLTFYSLTFQWQIKTIWSEHSVVATKHQLLSPSVAIMKSLPTVPKFSSEFSTLNFTQTKTDPQFNPQI